MRVRILLGITVATIAATGCNIHEVKDGGATSGAEVGQVNLDIVSIDQWRDVQSRFQSNYELTGPNAVKAVGQAQAFDSSATARSESISAGIEADGSIVNNDKSSSNQTLTAGGVTTTSASSTNSSDTKQSTPSAAPSMPPTTSGAISTTPLASGSLPGLAPQLQYQAGDALLKYAAVLDGGYGQIAPCGYVPILVTFRVSIIPSKHNLPYDTYLDIALKAAYDFNGGGKAKTATVPPSSSSPLSQRVSYAMVTSLPKEASLSFSPNPPKPASSASSSYPMESASAKSSSNTPEPASADPMSCGRLIRSDDIELVTFSYDSLENMQSDVVAQQTKAIILAAAVRAGKVAGSAGYQHLAAQLDHDLALKPNSLLSGGKRGRNALHIRLGANRFGNDEYEMLPLEHDVSVLALVPYQMLGKSIVAVGNYYFEDARTSTSTRVQDRVENDPLPPVDDAWKRKQSVRLQRIASSVIEEEPQAAQLPLLTACKNDANKCDDLRALAHRAQNKSFNEFLDDPSFGNETNISRVEPTQLAEVAEDLWQNLLPELWQPGITQVTAELPYSLRWCPQPNADILVKDDGTNAIASVTGAAGYAGQEIIGVLALSTERTIRSGQTASAMKVSHSRAATFEIATSDLGDLTFLTFSDVFNTSDQGNVRGSLTIKSRDGLICSLPDSEHRIIYILKNKPATTSGGTKGTPGISGYPLQVDEIQGVGSVSFTVALSDAKADSVLVSTNTAAQLSSVTPAGGQPISSKGGQALILASGDYMAQLVNLAPDKAAILTFQFKLGKKLLGKPQIVLAVTKP